MTGAVRPCTIPAVDLNGFMALVNVDDAALAVIVGCNRSTISRIRRRKTRPESATLMRIQAWADDLAKRRRMRLTQRLRWDWIENSVAVAS